MFFRIRGRVHTNSLKEKEACRIQAPLSLLMRIPQLPQETSSGHIWLSQSHDPTSLPTLFHCLECISCALQIPVSLLRLSSHIIWTLMSPQHHRGTEAPFLFWPHWQSNLVTAANLLSGAIYSTPVLKLISNSNNITFKNSNKCYVCMVRRHSE